MKKGAQGMEDIKATTFYGQFIKEIVFLVTTLRVCHIATQILSNYFHVIKLIVFVIYFISLHSISCRFSLISVVRYCISWHCRAPTFPWLYQFQIPLPSYSLRSQAGFQARKKCIEVRTREMMIIIGKCFKLVALRSALLFRYVSGNDTYAMWNHNVLLGQIESNRGIVTGTQLRQSLSTLILPFPVHPYYLSINPHLSCVICKYCTN